MLTAFPKRETYAQLHSRHLSEIAQGNTPSLDTDTHRQLLQLLALDGITEDSLNFKQQYLLKYAKYCLAHRHAANPNCRDLANDRQTPLMKAALRNDIPLMELLVAYKARVDDLDTHSNTALHLACAVGNLNAVNFLLQNQASTLSPNSFGQYPIHFAVRFPEILTTLLAEGSPINLLCDAGKTPLHYAVENNAPIETFEILIKGGANFMHQDKQQKTPLQVGSSSVYLQSIGCDTQLQTLENTVIEKAKVLSNDAKWQFLLQVFHKNAVDLPPEVHQLILENVNHKDFVSAAQSDDGCKALISSFHKMHL